MTLHHPLLLLALVPLGAMMWWAIMSMREIDAMQRQNKREQADMERMFADLERRFPHLRDDWRRDG